MSVDIKCALIGSRVSYSKSPAIFNAIFDQLGVKGSYETFDIQSDQIEMTVKKLKDEGWLGSSVTIPHKKKVIEYLDELDPVAKSIEAVNSISVDGDKLIGYNTDCHGFSVPLMPYSERLKYGQSVILGNGGAARAVIYALHVNFEIKSFLLVGRDMEKLERCRKSLVSKISKLDIRLSTYDNLNSNCPSEVDLLVNSTPIGGWNHHEINPLPEDFHLKNCKICYDLNYNNNNRFLADSKNAGCLSIDGSVMLVGQAIKSFEIWSGNILPFEPIYEKVFGN